MIAERAGVSIGTVDRVLHDRPYVKAPGDVLFSLMSQYTPQPDAQGRLARRVTRAEYRAAAEYMRNCGIVDGFTQERTAAKEEYTPPFDLTGV